MDEIGSEDLKNFLDWPHRDKIDPITQNVSMLWCYGTMRRYPNTDSNEILRYISLSNVKLRKDDGSALSSAQGKGDKLNDAMDDLFAKMTAPDITLVIDNTCLGTQPAVIEVVYRNGTFIPKPPPRIAKLMPKPLRLKVP